MISDRLNRKRRQPRSTTNFKVKLSRTYHHLHPFDPVAKADLVISQTKWDGSNKKKYLVTGPESLKFPSLGGGLARKPDGTPLALAELDRYLGTEIAQSSFYLRQIMRPDGRVQYRKQPTDGLRDLAITIRSDHALAFQELDQSGFSVAEVVEDFGKFTAQGLHGATGYRVRAYWVHTEEGRLHLHITYSTVDEANQLIHQEGRRGRHGPVHAFASVIGTVRLGRLGWLPKEWHDDAEGWLRDRSKNGQQPLDWVLSEALDGWIEAWVDRQDNRVKEVFARHFEAHRQEIADMVAHSPAKLWEQLEKTEAARNEALEMVQRLAREKERLELAVGDLGRDNAEQQRELEKLRQKEAQLKKDLSAQQASAAITGMRRKQAEADLAEGIRLAAKVIPCGALSTDAAEMAEQPKRAAYQKSITAPLAVRALQEWVNKERKCDAAQSSQPPSER
jgi:uncharacterized protein YeeX (DUF496 family)